MGAIMSDTPKRWLVIAHCFNMDGQAASHHITDKIPYLAERGIEPVVLSAATGRKDQDVEHHQVTSPAPSGLRFELRHIIRERYGNSSFGKFLKALISVILFPFYLIEKCLVRFDSQWSWFLTAERKGADLLRQRPFDLIYVSGGASSAFLTAYRLSKKYGVPWIAEIYDPMIHGSWLRGKMSYWWNAKIESLICRHAKAVFWYTREAINQAQHRHPHVSDRAHLMRPGMAPPEFGEVRYVKGAKLRISYFGGLTPERNLGYLGEAVKRVVAQDSEIANHIEINVYGGMADPVTRASFGQLPQGIIRYHGRLEHDPASGKSGRQRVLEAMRQSDVLVLMHGKGEICKLYLPSKIYEYLWALRPVLLFTPVPDHWGEILDERDHYIVDQHEESAGEAVLMDIIQDWRTGKLSDRDQSQAHSVENAVRLVMDATDQ